MRKSRMVCAIAAAALCAMAISCGKKDTNPVEPPDQPPGNVILSEGFEGYEGYVGDSLFKSNYRQITYTPEQGLMSISTQHHRTGSGSLTSDSNYTGIKKLFEPFIEDSIAGLQFYLMATQASHTNLLVALCKPGSSSNGLFTIMGMGIDTSDSLRYVYEENPFDPSVQEHRNFAALALNKWYKCKIEYDYSDTTLTYFLDNDTVYTRTAPSPITLQYFVVMRDGLGTQGPAGYYLDDVCIYKR